MSGLMVIGLDVGGTSTRAAVISTMGERLGAGRAGGGNPTSHGAQQAATQLSAALADALATVDPGQIRAGTIGLAGAGRVLSDPPSRAAFDRAWRDAGLRCPYTICSDALVAYASGTAAPDGTILVAGTGAIAADVQQLTLHHIADGHGWLLGDAGSGFWLGREAVRHTLADLDARRELSLLSQLVLTSLLGSAVVETQPRHTVDRIIQTVTRQPPVELATLAPLVIRAYDAGDQAAESLIHEAAAHLTESVARIRPPDAATPIVLAGGLLTAGSPAIGAAATNSPAGTPLAVAVHQALARHWPHAPLHRAGDGALGAAWLAARALPEVTEPAVLHQLLFA